MVDTETYKSMHQEEDEEPSPECVELGDDLMHAEEVPREPFILLLPAKNRGYGLHNKRWSTFNAAQTTSPLTDLQTGYS